MGAALSLPAPPPAPPPAAPPPSPLPAPPPGHLKAALCSREPPGGGTATGPSPRSGSAGGGGGAAPGLLSSELTQEGSRGGGDRSRKGSREAAVRGTCSLAPGVGRRGWNSLGNPSATLGPPIIPFQGTHPKAKAKCTLVTDADHSPGTGSQDRARDLPRGGARAPTLVVPAGSTWEQSRRPARSLPAPSEGPSGPGAPAEPWLGQPPPIWACPQHLVATSAPGGGPVRSPPAPGSLASMVVLRLTIRLSADLLCRSPARTLSSSSQRTRGQ